MGLADALTRHGRPRGLAAALALAAGAWLLSGCASTLLTKEPPLQHATTTFVRATTKDNWTLFIRRFRPNVLDPQRAPVVLCHGLNCNDRLWDISPDVSLARYLAERGYDVWVPALRGAGQSDKPGIVMVRRAIRPVFPELPGTISVRTIDPLSLNWTIDDYVQYDVPTILAKVREETGAPTVHWVGHSLGGIIIYAYVEQFGDSELASISTLGAPLTIPQPPNNFLRAFRDNKDLIKIVTLLVSATVAVQFPVLDQRSGVAAAMYNPANVDHSVLREFFTRGIEDIPVGVLDQLVQAVETGELHSHNGQLDYAQLLEKVTVPAFVAGGLVDVIASPESVRFVYSHIGSQKKAFHIFCVVNNDTIDYGHMDLVFGRYAPRDVFPAIEHWLSEHPLAAPYSPPPAKASGLKALLP
jgi:pimeloyl-ACP methyl ester carboxylesterase